MKCCKCDKEAKYDAPDRLCTRHWVEWFNSHMAEYGYTQEQIERENDQSEYFMELLDKEESEKKRHLTEAELTEVAERAEKKFPSLVFREEDRAS